MRNGAPKVKNGQAFFGHHSSVRRKTSESKPQRRSVCKTQCKPQRRSQRKTQCNRLPQCQWERRQRRQCERHATPGRLSAIVANRWVTSPSIAPCACTLNHIQGVSKMGKKAVPSLTPASIPDPLSSRTTTATPTTHCSTGAPTPTIAIPRTPPWRSWKGWSGC